MFDFSWLSDPGAWVSLLTLALLEIVLGIDNIIFISILTGKLPAEQQPRARKIGLTLALVMRLVLLASIFWITKLTKPLFTIPGFFGLNPLDISGKDLVLIMGGLFLIWKSVKEMHHSLEGVDHANSSGAVTKAFAAIIGQIVLVDLVFSIDSVITAVGLAKHLSVMTLAVLVSMAVMLAAAGSISAFVNRHPTVKMLALSFLLLVGIILVIDGLHHHIPKGYIYFAMAFSFAVEMLNIKMRKNAEKPVELRHEI